jgi:GT2 family glycosyltransferase
MISILLLNYNGREFLKECITSVLNQTYSDFELIFFDNCSTDGSAGFVFNTFNDNRIKLHTSDKNLGFAGGNNKALEYAKGEYIVLLNNDTLVESNWLEELVKTVSSSDETGMAQSLVYTEGIPLRYYEKNGTINLLGHNIMEVFTINEDGTGEVVQANGCSLIIKRKVLDEIKGLFEDEYFAYAEDTFLSLKVMLAGYKIVHNALSVVHHKGSSTMKKYKSEFTTFHQERNRILNFMILFSRSFRIKYIFLFVMNFKIKFLYSLFSKRYSVKGIIRAYFWILGNHKWLKEMRNKYAGIKSADEKDILAKLSGRFANGDNFLEKILNLISLTYLRIVRIKTIELS